MPEALGYVVAIARDSGLRLPSFTDVYDTPEDAAAHADVLAASKLLGHGEYPAILELVQVHVADA